MKPSSPAFPIDGVLYKKCNSCEALLPVSEFYKHTKTADGFYPACKRCHTMRCNNLKRLKASRPVVASAASAAAAPAAPGAPGAPTVPLDTSLLNDQTGGMSLEERIKRLVRLVVAMGPFLSAADCTALQSVLSARLREVGGTATDAAPPVHPPVH